MIFFACTRLIEMTKIVTKQQNIIWILTKEKLCGNQQSFDNRIVDFMRYICIFRAYKVFLVR